MSAEADSHLLRIVLENLNRKRVEVTSKAAKPHIEIGALKDHGRATFFVRDNGAGFEMAYADKLSARFSACMPQASTPAPASAGDVQRIVHRHGDASGPSGSRQGSGVLLHAGVAAEKPSIPARSRKPWIDPDPVLFSKTPKSTSSSHCIRSIRAGSSLVDRVDAEEDLKRTPPREIQLKGSRRRREKHEEKIDPAGRRQPERRGADAARAQKGEHRQRGCHREGRPGALDFLFGEGKYAGREPTTMPAVSCSISSFPSSTASTCFSEYARPAHQARSRGRPHLLERG